MSGLVAAIDPGSHQMGYCVGLPRRRDDDPMPWSAAIKLRKASEDRNVAFGNLIAFLGAQWRNEFKPIVVVTEAPKPLMMLAKIGAGQAAADMAYGIDGIIRGMCARFGVRYEQVADSTARKHFLGVGRLGDRDATKAAVVARARLLGYMPADTDNDNRADACCIWDWAAATLMRAPPRELHLFGEKPATTKGVEW